MKRLKFLVPILLLIASLGFSAELLRYVDPDAAGGGTGLDWTNAYTSLNAWEAGQAQDLTDAGGDWMHTYVRASSDTADTTATLLSGFTTATASYVLIEAASGEEALVTGYSETRYRIEVSDDESLYLLDDYYRFKNLQIKTTTTGTTSYGLRIHANAGGDIYVDSCRIEGVGGGAAILIGITTGGSGRLYVYNTIVNNMGQSGASNKGMEVSGGAAELYNNVVYNAYRGVYFAAGGDDNDTTIKNSAIFGNNDDVLDSNTGSTIDFNSSDDNDGTNNIAGNEIDATWSTDFNDAGNGDFTLLVGSPLYSTGGVDNPGAGLYSTDIAGTAYVSTWPIGAFQPVVAGGTSAARIGVFGNPLVGPFGGAISAMLFLLNIFLTIKLIQAYRKAAFWKGEALFYADTDNLNAMNEINRYLKGEL